MKTTILLDQMCEAGTEIMDNPQNTKTESFSLEIVDMGNMDNFSGLRNNRAFDFWKSKEEDIY